MEVTGAKPRDDDGDESAAGAPAAGARKAEDVPAGQLVAGAVGDRCATCGSPMASDQRYCVQCGGRRGKARFTVASLPGQTGGTAAGSQGTPPQPARRRPPSAAALIAGIATLLLAMGVGVEIGRLGKNNTSTERASGPSVQVVTVGGGSGGGSAAVANTSTANTNTNTNTNTAPAAPTQTSATNTKASNTKTNAAFAPTATIAKKVQAQAQSTAQQVLGSNSVKLAPATVKQGQSCSSNQAGCQNGHFTGNYFSP